MVFDRISFEIECKISATVNLKFEKETATNIVGFIEGSDPILKNEYIVIGAHYDHLGYGGNRSGSLNPDSLQIHNGADDNASGTAGVLELSHKLMMNKSSRRNVSTLDFLELYFRVCRIR